MSKKYVIGIIALLVISLAIYGCSNLKSSYECTNYILDDEHKITDSSRQPKGTLNSMKSPNDDSMLKQIVLDPDDPNFMDESWRFAYYSETEKLFWIADMPGEFFAGWYGPYIGYPCKE